MMDRLEIAAEMIRDADFVTAFTGAGISMDSGLPAFRRDDAFWSYYDPDCVELAHFLADPGGAWINLREIFYDAFTQAAPNEGHYALVEMEAGGYLDAIITQNIDNLHHKAGNTHVHEFHGSAGNLACIGCGARFAAAGVDLCRLPPRCNFCGGVLKPDFVFFGETVSDAAESDAIEIAELSDLILVVGAMGDVQPACHIPFLAAENGARIVEINPEASRFTFSITDLFLQGEASEILEALMEALDEIP
jgi:NAD-dependent deacetylase